MASRHGSRSRYNAGCRCDECKAAEASYQEKRRQTRLAAADDGPSSGSVVQLPGASRPVEAGPGPVESAVAAEMTDLAQATARPGLAQTALALARIMDNPKATNQQPAAAAKLAEILDKLHKGADARKSKLAAVRAMTSAKSAAG